MRLKQIAQTPKVIHEKCFYLLVWHYAFHLNYLVDRFYFEISIEPANVKEEVHETANKFVLDDFDFNFF